MSDVPPVNSPVFSLAGSQTTNRGMVPPEFRDPMPLGVRLFSIASKGEWWVTRFVDDIQYRSVIPGGFASATITLRLPHGTTTLATSDLLGFSRVTELFNRIQVVDLRSSEVAWEGRIEDPARQVDPDTWQIGALGSMVAATDISRPVFYIDTSMDRWTGGDRLDESGTFLFPVYLVRFDNTKDDEAKTLTTKYNTNEVFGASVREYSWRWDSHGYDQPIARFTTTHNGTTSNSVENANTVVLIGIAENPEVDVTTWSTTGATKTNVIGTDFTGTNTRYILFGARRKTGASDYNPSSGEVIQIRMVNPKVQGKRTDRTGSDLDTAASYPADYVTVAQVVEDVIGRFLVGGWYQLAFNVPLPGSIRSQDVYIDSSDTTQILHLVYPDGATAADILNDMITKVQTDAYWALWESTEGAINSSAPTTGFRFEYATWPNNWGYLATSQDGLEGQPNGDDVYNFIFYRYPDSGDVNAYHVTTAWHNNEMAPELLTGGFTRSVTVNKDDPTDGTTANALRDAYLDSKKKVQNAGTLTVRRPIQLYDAGANSSSGAGRVLDPWMIRPGKLVRIIDLPPRAGGTDRAHGSIPPVDSLNGVIFKVVATDYSSSDNSCRMELDQVARWQLPTQIATTGSGSKTIRIQ